MRISGIPCRPQAFLAVAVGGSRGGSASKRACGHIASSAFGSARACVDMSPSRGEKRKRSTSPAKSKSPEVKKGKFGQLLSFLTPSKSGKDVEDKKKKRLSFGAPVVHAFDAFSPPCRRRPLHDNCAIDAQNMEKGACASCLYPCGVLEPGSSVRTSHCVD